MRHNNLEGRKFNPVIKTVLPFIIWLIFLSGCIKDNQGPSFEEQLLKDIAIIDSYLADNGIVAEEHSSGLRYVVHLSGSGNQPSLTNCIKFNYTGKFLSGQMFGSGEDVKVKLASRIPGFQIGMPLIAIGGSITLYIPSGFGYGTQGFPPTIPPNSNLIFEIDLLDVTTIDQDTGACN